MFFLTFLFEVPSPPIDLFHYHIPIHAHRPPLSSQPHEISRFQPHWPPASILIPTLLSSSRKQLAAKTTKSKIKLSHIRSSDHVGCAHNGPFDHRLLSESENKRRGTRKGRGKRCMSGQLLASPPPPPSTMRRRRREFRRRTDQEHHVRAVWDRRLERTMTVKWTEQRGMRTYGDGQKEAKPEDPEKIHTGKGNANGKPKNTAPLKTYKGICGTITICPDKSPYY